jgi:predicted ATPase
MRIEAIRLKNFRVFREVELRDLPSFAVFVGANGTGKSTLFSVFQFLQDAMATNVTAALGKLGGSRGFIDVRTRDAAGPIEISFDLRITLRRSEPRLVTYELVIDEDQGRPVVVREILSYHHREGEQPWKLFEFHSGEGYVVADGIELVEEETQLQRQTHYLKSPDILAIKALAQLQRFPAAVELGTFIESWHLSDLHLSRVRTEQEAGYAEHLSRTGENLSLVLEYLQKQHPALLAEILERLGHRIPGLERVESKVTEEGRVLLRFQDGSFEDPFFARQVSDGTIKMLAYLMLLLDPAPHPLLCVEEPENQLYPSLLSELAEEFRAYAVRGGQVFVSTHSPDFLNAVELDEVFWLIKRNGTTQILRGRDDAQVRAYMAEGDQLGYLWKQGLFDNVDPR